jgi:endonuclease YncB( thermonuclease family)
MNTPPLPVIACGLAVAMVGAVITRTIPGETRGTVPASAIRITDGDTVRLGDERIRLLDIDAPELFSPHCPAERVAARRAKSALTTILAGRMVTIDREPSPDRYGRTLARLVVGGTSAGDRLQAQGFALPYRPGRDAHRERIAHWCGPGDW